MSPHASSNRHVSISLYKQHREKKALERDNVSGAFGLGRKGREGGWRCVHLLYNSSWKFHQLAAGQLLLGQQVRYTEKACHGPSIQPGGPPY
jgi:hypothetical protein